MRLRSRIASLVVVLGCAQAILTIPPVREARAQDFDPRGRRKPKPSAPKPVGKPTAKPTPGPAVDPKAPKVPASGDKAATLLERYTRIVIEQPGSPFPLQRLAQLYRDRDGNIAALVADFEKRAGAGGADHYPVLVSLAGIYKLDGRGDQSVATYEKAIAEKADDPAARVALARLLADRADFAGARTHYEKALASQTLAADKEQTLRTLLSVALDAKDWDGAKKYFGDLVKLQPTSLFLRGELGRELFARGEFKRAEAEFKDLVTAAAGDNRALAPALKELGRAQAKAHENQEALATLKRALAVAGSEAAVRAEIYETITELYRADQQLPILVKQLEAERPTDFPRLLLLGGLYEETGDATNALATYRRAAAVNPRHIDLRIKLIRLLQSQGELDKAIAEYDGLIRAAPNNPQFVFEQCDALMQRGERARALTLLAQLEARSRGDEDLLARVADFYGRIGENERSVRVLERLTQVAANDPAHFADLGDRYYQDGNTTLAVQTWKRILVAVSPRARALSALGDVYLEHDMPAEALAVLREASVLEPQNLTVKKQLASVLERTKSYRDARALWQELAEKAKEKSDKLLAREARSHVVTLWSLERVLEAQIAPLAAKFAGPPPDLEAGRTLAEVQIHMRRSADAEATLRKILAAAKGDADSYLALERVLVQQNKTDEAIAVLERLVEVDPKRARELYQRMAQYARNDDAIKYAARAVELNPDDAEGHRRLGVLYRERQEIDRAISEFRQAIAKNDRLFPVYFQLADLHLSRGESDEADRLFRRVLRGAPDEDLVAQAGRLSLQINMSRGSVEALEQDLLPLAIGNPQKGVYRRLLIEVYEGLTFDLVQKVRHGSGTDAELARASLARIGARAVKPLLDALADGDAGQQRVAIDVLGYVANRNAGAPLFAYATGTAGSDLRTRAMVACGNLKDPALIARYEAYLSPGRKGGDGLLPTDAIAVAATWGVARMGDRRTLPLLRSLAREGSPEMRAIAAVGLGASHDRSVTPELVGMVKAMDGGALARSGAAFALGELGEVKEAGTLVSVAQSGEVLPRQMALLSLARMGVGKKEPPGGRAAVQAMADALFTGVGSDSVRSRQGATSTERAGMIALTLLGADPARVRALRRFDDPLALEGTTLDVESLLSGFLPEDLEPSARTEAFVRHGDAIQRAAVAALQTSGERARSVLDAIGGPKGTFAPFVDATTPGFARADEGTGGGVRARPFVVPLARHPDPQLRIRAITSLASSTSDLASSAILGALDDGNEAVVRMAIRSIGPHSGARAGVVLRDVLAHRENWSLRVMAADALGGLGKGGRGDVSTPALRDAATGDGFALVREASLRALASYDPKAAAVLAETMRQKDPEPRVRDAALAILRARP
ncbi:MAG: tetratricopeptide repeat protein [Polyangiaceae bacterium]